MSSETDNDQNARPTVRRAVSVLTLETGGCGACVQSIAALQASVFADDVAAQRITFVRSPHQADVVLLSGPLSNVSNPAVRRVLDQVAEPQALVAVGDCAITGCVFAGSPQISASASEALDVHIELPGCPPSPSAILNAIAKAAELLAEGDAEEEEAEEAAGTETIEDTEDIDDIDDIDEVSGADTPTASVTDEESDESDAVALDEIDEADGESDDEDDEVAGDDEPKTRVEGDK